MKEHNFPLLLMFRERLLGISFLAILSNICFATEQVPDTLEFNGLKVELKTGWGHPSPLETYFMEKRIAYPFRELSTANYRGHVATWVIKDKQLYLKSICVESVRHSPEKFGIHLKENGLSDASWFNGVLEAYKFYNEDRKSYIFLIKGGRVVLSGEYSAGEYNALTSDTSRLNRKEKQKLALLKYNENYITYWYRLGVNDEIVENGIRHHLNTGPWRLSPLYALYGNNHLLWPFNWENLEQCGAPHCIWTIKQDSLYLTGVQLYSGLRFDSADKVTIPLSTILHHREEEIAFANWVSGVYLIVSRPEAESINLIEYPTPSQYRFCKFERGILKKSYTAPFSYDFFEKLDDLQSEFKAIVKEYLKGQ